MSVPKVKVDAWQCLRCGYIWISRDKRPLARPIACAKCKSRYWDRPRRK